jgi:hypothetical protein
MLAKLRMPALIIDAENDILFDGQPPRAAKTIGSNATLMPFTDEDAAGEHCAAGALTYQNQQIFEWFADVTRE